MSVFTGIILYILIWWTALFCVLPIGTRPDTDAEETPGGWRGAPVKPQLGRKLLGTTVLAAVIWGGVYVLIDSDWLSFRTGILAMP